jgi:hypothetical protein
MYASIVVHSQFTKVKQVFVTCLMAKIESQCSIPGGFFYLIFDMKEHEKKTYLTRTLV